MFPTTVKGRNVSFSEASHNSTQMVEDNFTRGELLVKQRVMS